MKSIEAKLVNCGHQTEGKCCFRTGHMCSILISTAFPDDDDCRFRKTEPEGKNLYDEGRTNEYCNQ